MNRLRNNLCYLSGAMEFMPDFGADWRKKFRSDLSDLGLVFLDPTDKPIDAIDEPTLLQKIKVARELEDYETIASGRVVRHIDLRMCDMAGIVIVNLDLETPTCGTWEEIYDSNRSKKPILVRCVQGKKYAPAWLFWTLPHQHIFSTWEEIYTYLRNVDSGVDNESYGRWLFFDLTGEKVR